MRTTIVTVCYNAEECIEKTIKSVLNQTVPVYEYVLIDGKSEDQTFEIIKKYSAVFQEKGIRYIYKSEKDRGISDAFNKGIALSTGELIGLINADDELMPETNEILQNACKKDYDIFYGNCLWIDEKNGYEYISKPKHKLDDLLYNMVLVHPSTFVKKTCYDECGVFDISYRYCMDKELLYRMYLSGRKFHYVDDVLTKFKAGGVSDVHAREVFREGSRMALSYGEPKLKVMMIEYQKIVRDKLVRFIKKTSVYKKMKMSKI